MSSVLVSASAYLIDAREDGHESTQHCSTDTGNVDKRTLRWWEEDTYEQHVMLSAQTLTIVCKTGTCCIRTNKSLYNCWMWQLPWYCNGENECTALLRTWILCFNPMRRGIEEKHDRGWFIALQAWRKSMVEKAIKEEGGWWKSCLIDVDKFREKADSKEMKRGVCLLLCPLASHCRDQQSAQWL